jgi:hypothetical protein
MRRMSVALSRLLLTSCSVVVSKSAHLVTSFFRASKAYVQHHCSDYDLN